MVLQWFIVDLRVSGEIQLLEKHIRMKRRFNRIFTTIWIGVSCVVVAGSINLICYTILFILRMDNFSFTDLSVDFPMASNLESTLYKDCISNNRTDILVLFPITECIVLVGFLFFFIPYIGYGLCTMSVLLWRLFRGKTGYRTHFPVHLTKSLI